MLERHTNDYFEIIDKQMIKVVEKEKLLDLKILREE